MAKPKGTVRVPRLPTSPSRTLRRAEGDQGVSAAALQLRASNGTVEENEKPVSVIGNSAAFVIQFLTYASSVLTGLVRRPPRPQLPAEKGKTEQDFKPALEEDETPVVSASISRLFLEAKDLQATAPAVWPSTLAPGKEEFGHGTGRQILTLHDVLQQKRASLEEAKQSLSPAAAASAGSSSTVVEYQSANECLSQTALCSPSISTGISSAAVVGKKPRAARGVHKLGVNPTLFKNRRKSASLGSWKGRQVRAEIKGKEA